MTQRNITIAFYIIVLFIMAVLGAYFGGKSVADRAAALKELRTERQQLQDELTKLKSERSEIKKDTNEKVEATRSNRAQIDAPRERIDDAEANIGIHIRPVPSDAQGSAPDAPSVVFPQQELPLLTSYITRFQTNAIELDGCKRELQKCDAAVKNLEKQTANLDGQVKIEAKKHGFWHRAGECALKIAIPAGIGYGFGGNKGAVAGAGAGGASCFIF